jgi:hypothetical protein
VRTAGQCTAAWQWKSSPRNGQRWSTVHVQEVFTQRLRPKDDVGACSSGCLSRAQKAGRAVQWKTGNAFNLKKY